ncbi:hypothetical protein J8273_7513 [Carpediemonas membranifera]|uniref:Uncharacterized protein n=1 Tax=Carpediemonas membranifera TaxID=201153 RepID=A0A8J6DXY9_9EUKA|nr:hypothetical protein J8273_7513 [Carpediemonas membranifera]|eukprot:KAG9391239.1 hypothetical protein J8273_7513 [Carpediemonas membranifera]
MRLLSFFVLAFFCSALSFDAFESSFTAKGSSFGRYLATDGSILAAGADSGPDGTDYIHIFEDPLDMSTEILIPNPTRSNSYFGRKMAMSDGRLIVLDRNETANIVYFIEKVDGAYETTEALLPDALQGRNMNFMDWDIRGNTAMVSFNDSSIVVFSRDANTGWGHTQVIKHPGGHAPPAGLALSDTQAVLLMWDADPDLAAYVQFMDKDPATGLFSFGETVHDMMPSHYTNGPPQFSPDGRSVAFGVWYTGVINNPYAVVLAPDGGGWTKSTLAIDHADATLFGTRLAWLSDAILAVGAQTTIVDGRIDGSVFIFTLSDDTWALTDTLTTPADERSFKTESRFGINLAYVTDLDALAVGASSIRVSASSSGKVFVFHDGTGAGDGASSDSTVLLVLAMTGGWFGLLALCVLVVVLFFTTILVCSVVAMATGYAITTQYRKPSGDAAPILTSTVVSRVVTPSATASTIEVQGDASDDEGESTHARHPSLTTLGSKPVLPPVRLPPMGAAKLSALLTPPRTMPVLPPMARPGVSLVKREES